MSLKEEFVALARQPGSNKRELCRRFGISPETGYKWLRRYEAQGWQGLQEKSRRPITSPILTQSALEAEVVKLRQEHPAWGGRKISSNLKFSIAPSTVTNVLHRHALILPPASHQPWDHDNNKENNYWKNKHLNEHH
jgi:transposase-like protein